MFNIGFGELVLIVLVCLVVFGPERLPEIARQIGRFIGQARLYTQRMLDELRSESELKNLNLPDLKVGNLRRQARNYVTELLDVEGQMAELEAEAKDRAMPGSTNGTPAAAAAKDTTDANGAAPPAGSTETTGAGSGADEAAEAGTASGTAGPGESAGAAGAAKPTGTKGRATPRRPTTRRPRATAGPSASGKGGAAAGAAGSTEAAGVTGDTASAPPVDPDAT